MSDTFIHADRTPWENTAAGIRRQILGHGADLMMVRVDFEAGAVGALHRHPHRQVTYVVSGRFEVMVDDQWRELAAGDSFYVGTELEHGVRAVEAGTLIDAFTPTRTDFLVPG